jgi:Zn-dependent peptidase ImmA (M78 family)/transcriptional regulator with XRE-family HTH domain
MTRGTLVPITPSVLAWAIRESGYSTADIAHRLNVPVEIVDTWATGDGQPTLTQFRKLAALLKRTPATFLLPRVPEQPRPAVEFRGPPGTERRALDPQERRYLREASRVQRVLSWVLGEVGEDLHPMPQSRIGADIDAVGGETRRRLAITKDQQLAWRNFAEALQAWRTALEGSGVLVFLLPLGRDGCRGFSLWDDRAPLIAVNTWWNTEARMFTLFHEYGHLLTRTNSACLEDGRRARGVLGAQYDPTERWCERFAAAVLMPGPRVDRVLQELGWRQGRPLHLTVVQSLARRFKVSLRAATLRLIERRVATWDLYNAIPALSDQKRGGGGGRGRVRRQIRQDQYGMRAAHLFLTALDHDLMTRDDILSYLDIPDTELDELQRSAAGR